MQIFAESFERYKAAVFSDASLLQNFLERWTTNFGLSQSITTGRNGQGLSMPFGATVSKTLAHGAEWVVGFAFRSDSIPTTNAGIWGLNNNSNALVGINFNVDGTLSLQAAGSIAVSQRALHKSRWYYIEAHVTLSGATPIMVAAELRINGKVECSGSGSTGANASAQLSNDATGNVHTFAGPTGGGTFDDIYIKDAAGYYGDIRIIALYPNGDVVTGWTPSAAGTHYTLVNEHPADEDVTYVKTATANLQDIYDWQDCPGFSGTIKAIDISALARKDDEGTKSFKIVVGDTGTEAASDEFFVSDTYEYYEYGLETDPATGLAWTQAGFNAKRFGVKLIS
jgi:hypothetical protein